MFLNKTKAITYLNQDLENNTTTTCYLTELELRCLYYCFGHPLVGRFHKVLERASYKTNFEKLKRLTKYYKQYQIYRKTPNRFKFTLKDNSDFNHILFVNVFILDSKPVLYIVDKATNFQDRRFLKDILVKNI
jgi:hypothetical protein